ncbi:MAG: hypothetical protein HUU49_04485 [Candidatus Buchananbacteria bacterium]|nr:hypothetical protein [Candidatus Buchananbacteria bacterium]
MNQDLGKNILEKIKESHIKPTPRWEFLLKDYVMWIIFIIAILVGSLATSVTIFMLRHENWDYYQAQPSAITTILINLPYFWLLILLAFLGLAWYNIKHTNKGYRYNTLAVLGISVIASILIGSVSYSVGLGEDLEDIFYKRFPFYHHFMENRARQLFSPAGPILGGVVVNVNSSQVEIQDFNGRLWIISTSTTQFDIGDRIILVGKKFEGDTFEIEILKPWFKQHNRLIEFHLQAPPPRTR